MKINKIYFQYLRNEAHYQYMSIVKKLFEKYTRVAVIVADHFKEFNALLDIERKLVDIVKTSEYTSKIAEARNRIDRDIIGIGNVVDASLRHFDPLIVKAAESLDLRLRPFRAKIGKKAYEELSAGVSILLDDLNNTFSAQIAMLGLEAWINELAEAHSNFDQLFAKRSNERADRPHYSLRKIRQQIDAVYRKIVEHIDSYNIANNTTKCERFVKELNAEIAYFNNRYRYRPTNDIRKVIVTSIPIQTLDAGQPATPIPEVFYKDTRLVFTVDYELSYRDNHKPGTAMVFIHGKGAYKGVRAISFNIKTNSNEQ